MPITIVVADDYPDYRLLVRLLLASVSDTIAIVGEAADGEEALALVLRERPDIVIADLLMPCLPRPFHTKGWVYEEKYDGWRMLAVKEAGRVRLISRNGRDHTKRFRDIADALAKLKPATFTLDGEVAVFDAQLVSRFEWLRHLDHGDLATPPLLMVFDLLQLGEKDYRLEPLKVRRRALEKLVKGQTLILPARRLSPNGFAAWAEVLHRGYEGMVAKDAESPYVGGRTLKWLKVKQAKYREGERGWDPKNKS